VKIYKISESEDYMKMMSFFETRTKKHIKLVQKYCKKIEDYDDKFDGLLEKSKDHDSSKFEDPELDPYIFITWKYKCEKDGIKFECPEDMDEKMDKATHHHVKNNAHHPEYYCDRKSDLINKNDRDKPPSEIIDATKMPDISIAEMCADWFAVSEEKNTSPKNWADKNVNIRWKFNDSQKELIYELINNIWE